MCGAACTVCGSGDPNHSHSSTAFAQPSQEALQQVLQLASVVGPALWCHRAAHAKACSSHAMLCAGANAEFV